MNLSRDMFSYIFTTSQWLHGGLVLPSILYFSKWLKKERFGLLSMIWIKEENYIEWDGFISVVKSTTYKAHISITKQ